MCPNHFPDELAEEAISYFRRMVESVGVKRFATSMGLSTRQINRMLSGVQPNPVERLVRCLQSSEAEVGDEALGYICQEAGGVFVKDETDLDAAAVNAVRECAEAIAAISDGQISRVDEREIRDAIGALTALLRVRTGGPASTDPTPTPAPVNIHRVGGAGRAMTSAGSG